MKSNIRLVFVNIAISILFLAGLNFVSNVLLFFPPAIKGLFAAKSETKNRESKDQSSKYSLPNFSENRDLAKLNFQEMEESFITKYEPFVEWKRQPFKGKTITVDEKGDRVHQNKANAKYSDLPVYFFGGSTMWGYGVVDNDTIPALFNSISGMPSYNKGETGFVSRQSLAQFINLLSQKERIKVAIFYEGINDIGYDCRAELGVNEHGRTAQYREILAEEDSKTKNSKVRETGGFLQYLDGIFLLGTRKLATQISGNIFEAKTVKSKQEGAGTKKLSVDQSYICDNSQERAEKVAETLVNNWEIAHDLAAARGIKFLAILQPVAFNSSPKLDHLKNLWNPSYEEEFGLQFKTVYPLMKKVIQERGHKWILDYTTLFDVDEYIYWDFAHVSKSGNSIIANQIYTDIKPDLAEEAVPQKSAQPR